MSKIDEILQELSNTVFQHGKATRTNTPFHYGEPMKDAKAELLQLVLEVIGEDTPEEAKDGKHIRYYTFAKAHNELLKEQRKRAKELFGDIK